MEISPSTKLTVDVNKQTIKIKDQSVRIVLHFIKFTIMVRKYLHTHLTNPISNLDKL